ncbi:MAG TPA: L,D-transpeptidase [Afifellaceae bacterium]|nr:L,D-transpeptidase [Afifellaceae bacterium]
MRVITWMALLALVAGFNGAQAAAHGDGKPPVTIPSSVEQPWIDQLRAGEAAEARQAPVQLAFHETHAQRRDHAQQQQRRGLLQLLFGQRPAAQPRRTYRSPARVAPRAAPQVQQRQARTAAAPRPAPAARTPKQRTIAPQFLPTNVDYVTEHEPGTIVIDPAEKFLYLVQEDGKARRYGIGVGREGFGWSGTVEVGRKAQWPTWTPPREMIKRQPWLAKYSKGMPGGPSNPLGARALYLHEDGQDTLYRIHGSNEPWTIGQAVSSGCFRMRNEDVTELYEQVPVGAKVVVL